MSEIELVFEKRFILTVSLPSTDRRSTTRFERVRYWRPTSRPPAIVVSRVEPVEQTVSVPEATCLKLEAVQALRRRKCNPGISLGGKKLVKCQQVIIHLRALGCSCLRMAISR